MENEVNVETKKKGNGLFTLFACVMTGIIVFLATNIGQKASKTVDPDTPSKNTSSNVESNVTSNIESNITSNVESNVTSNVVSNSNVTSNVVSNTTSNVTSNKVEQVTVRTYRVFGYIDNQGPDMYTTLKLYSNNKYELFVNVCSGVQKYTGTYTENDKNVVLSGKVNMTLPKGKGDSLKFDYDKVNACGDSGGTLALENSTLGSSNKSDVVGTKTYRFFGYTDNNGPDMYTSLKLYPDNKYELFVNVCSGVKKYSGTYTETSTGITLKGEMNITFAKDKGNALKFDFNKIDACGDSGGRFVLESEAIGK